MNGLPHGPRITAVQGQPNTLTIQFETVAPVAAPDELLAFPFGLEAAAAARLVKDGTLRAAKIGRKLYAKRSDIVSLVDKLAVPVRAQADDEYGAAVVALASRRRGAL